MTEHICETCRYKPGHPNCKHKRKVTEGFCRDWQEIPRYQRLNSSKELPAGWDPKWAKINAGEQTK